MEHFITNQRAYVGKFALLDPVSNKLIGGGGVTVGRPRLYSTGEAATEAVAAIDPTTYKATKLVPVLLV